MGLQEQTERREIGLVLAFQSDDWAFYRPRNISQKMQKAPYFSLFEWAKLGAVIIHKSQRNGCEK